MCWPPLPRPWLPLLLWTTTPGWPSWHASDVHLPRCILGHVTQPTCCMRRSRLLHPAARVPVKYRAARVPVKTRCTCMPCQVHACSYGQPSCCQAWQHPQGLMMATCMHQCMFGLHAFTAATLGRSAGTGGLRQRPNSFRAARLHASSTWHRRCSRVQQVSTARGFCHYLCQ